jgi:hypothetical protein
MLTKVILLQSVPSLGSASSVVSVKLGYAKNFLIKKRLAIFANEENLKQVDKIKGDLSEKDARLKSVATSIQSSCKEISIDLRSVSFFPRDNLGSNHNYSLKPFLKAQFHGPWLSPSSFLCPIP